jgi:flavin reductase
MSVDASQFKSALKLWASGVSVVTTTSIQKQHKGMTVTAFNSVSMDPPQILVCLNQGSDTGSAIMESRVFAVNILAEHQQDVSNLFAGGLSHEQRFETVAWQVGSKGSPLLTMSLASLECRVVQQVQAGSHWVVIGEVENVVCRSGEPLLYYHGGYRQLSVA